MAVKIISLADENIEIVNKEIEILKSLKHRNVLKYLASIRNQGLIYIITELCAKGNLQEYIHHEYDLDIVPEHRARIYFRQICRGVGYLHENSIAHRDIKMDNVFVTADLTLKIGDFGFGKNYLKSVLRTVAGTPVYMAPELFNKQGEYTEKQDIWSLGVLLYKMLTGRYLFRIDTQVQLKNLVEQARVRMGKGWSPELQTLMRMMLHKDPEKRWNMQRILNCKWLAQN